LAVHPRRIGGSVSSDNHISLIMVELGGCKKGEPQQ
jgi:hypothetical protein